MRSSRLQELPGMKCSFLSDCECTFSGFCVWTLLEPNQRKTHFYHRRVMDPKHLSSQMWVCHVSTVHNMWFFCFFSHVLGMQVVREVGEGGGDTGNHHDRVCINGSATEDLHTSSAGCRGGIKITLDLHFKRLKKHAEQQNNSMRQ